MNARAPKAQDLASKAVRQYHDQLKKESWRKDGTIGYANFTYLEKMQQNFELQNPRTHSDYERIMNGEIIGQPIGTPVVGYSPTSQGVLTPQMGLGGASLTASAYSPMGHVGTQNRGQLGDNWFSDVLSEIGDSVSKSWTDETAKAATYLDPKNLATVIVKSGVEYVKDQAGNLINKQTGKPAPASVVQNAPTTPPGYSKIPGIGNVKTTWLIVSGGVLGVGMLAILLKRRKD